MTLANKKAYTVGVGGLIVFFLEDMIVLFQNTGLMKECSSIRNLTKKYGAENGRKIMRTILGLQAAQNVQDIPHHMKCHPLKQDRKGQFSIYVKHPYRLIFEPANTLLSLELSAITTIRIIEIIDYH